MTSLKRNKILSALLTFAMVGVIILAYSAISLSLEVQKHNEDMQKMELDHSAALILAQIETLEQLKTEEAKRIEVEQALSLALKRNSLLLTLSANPMEKWTVKQILETRELFDSIPYGSPFEKGHIVTGSFGSNLLSGTYWKEDGHIGVDIFPKSGNLNEIIQAVIDGRVVTWGRNDRVYGNYLVIESLDGLWQIKLAHLSSIAIFTNDGTIDLYEGMEFKRGDRIAKMGNTGKTTGGENEGHHVHMEYYRVTDEGMQLLNADTIMEYQGTEKESN